MWVDQLINEYEQGRKSLVKLTEGLTDSELDKSDKTQIISMIRDMTFCIDWLKTGREPGNLRGIDRRSVYQRRVLMDMELYPSLEIAPNERELTNDEKQAIVDILVDLSLRERQCFILHNAYKMSMAAIGKELDISKSTVQTFLTRANKKINKKAKSYDCRSVAN